MNIHKLFPLAILLILPISFVYGVSAPEYTAHHGTACQPANLGQSINFKTRWSETGIRNTNPLGSGRNFFVICPVVTPHDNVTLTGTSDMFINPFYVDHDGTNQLNCFARRYRQGVLVKQVSVTNTRAAGFSGNSAFNLNTLTDIADGGFSLGSGLGDYHVLVCRLVPQSGIIGYVYDYD